MQKLHVAEQLCLMNRKDARDCLAFDEHATFDQEVEAKHAFAHEAFVEDRNGALGLDRKAPQRQFTGEAPFINRFEQSRPLVLMNFNRRGDDLSGQCFGISRPGAHVNSLGSPRSSSCKNRIEIEIRIGIFHRSRSEVGRGSECNAARREIFLCGQGFFVTPPLLPCRIGRPS